jgi:hypothetical protein
VGVAAAVNVNIGFGVPFRIGNKLVGLTAPEKLFRNAALLLDHEWRAFRFPDSNGFFDLGRINLDVNESDDRHGGLLGCPE